MHLDLRQLRHLVTIARRQSFSKAAEALGVTQPALSRSIAVFETEFGIRVFDRSKSGVTPTPIGADIVDTAEVILAQADRLVRDIRSWADADMGSVGIGCGPLIAGLVLPPLLSRLATERPRVEVRTVMDSVDGLVTALHQRRIEFALFAGALALNWSDIHVETIGGYRLQFIVRAGHPLATRASVTDADLQSFPLATGARPELLNPLPGATPAAPSPTIICENFAVLEEAVLTSDIVWLTSPDILRGTRKAQFATLNVPGWANAAQDICLARLVTRDLSPIGAVITDLLRAQFAGSADEES